MVGRWHSPSPNWQEKYHLHTTYSPCLLGGEKCYRSHLLGEPFQQPLIQLPNLKKRQGSTNKKVMMDFNLEGIIDIYKIYKCQCAISWVYSFLGGGNSNIFLECSSRKLGKCMIQFDGSHIFQMGWFNHQPILLKGFLDIPSLKLT